MSEEMPARKSFQPEPLDSEGNVIPQHRTPTVPDDSRVVLPQNDLASFDPMAMGGDGAEEEYKPRTTLRARSIIGDAADREDEPIVPMVDASAAERAAKDDRVYNPKAGRGGTMSAFDDEDEDDEFGGGMFRSHSRDVSSGATSSIDLSAYSYDGAAPSDDEDEKPAPSIQIEERDFGSNVSEAAEAKTDAAKQQESIFAKQQTAEDKEAAKVAAEKAKAEEKERREREAEEAKANKSAEERKAAEERVRAEREAEKAKQDEEMRKVLAQNAADAKKIAERRAAEEAKAKERQEKEQAKLAAHQAKIDAKKAKVEAKAEAKRKKREERAAKKAAKKGTPVPAVPQEPVRGDSAQAPGGATSFLSEVDQQASKANTAAPAAGAVFAPVNAPGSQEPTPPTSIAEKQPSARQQKAAQRKAEKEQRQKAAAEAKAEAQRQKESAKIDAANAKEAQQRQKQEAKDAARRQKDEAKARAEEAKRLESERKAREKASRKGEKIKSGDFAEDKSQEQPAAPSQTHFSPHEGALSDVPKAVAEKSDSGKGLSFSPSAPAVGAPMTPPRSFVPENPKVTRPVEASKTTFDLPKATGKGHTIDQSVLAKSAAGAAALAAAQDVSAPNGDEAPAEVQAPAEEPKEGSKFMSRKQRRAQQEAAEGEQSVTEIADNERLLRQIDQDITNEKIAALEENRALALEAVKAGHKQREIERVDEGADISDEERSALKKRGLLIGAGAFAVALGAGIFVGAMYGDSIIPAPGEDAAESEAVDLNQPYINGPNGEVITVARGFLSETCGTAAMVGILASPREEFDLTTLNYAVNGEGVQIAEDGEECRSDTNVYPGATSNYIIYLDDDVQPDTVTISDGSAGTTWKDEVVPEEEVAPDSGSQPGADGEPSPAPTVSEEG